MRRVLAALMLLTACKSKAVLADLYCEGGVIKGQGSGDCMAITSGTAFFTNHPERRYTLKPNGKDHFQLFLDGFVEGALDVDGDWIHVTLVSDARKHNLRSDAPGFLN